MPITNIAILDFSNHKGGNRAQAVFTATDGREVIRSISNAGNTPSGALVKAHAMSSEVLSSLQKNDAAEAVTLGIVGPHKEATSGQVTYKWLLQAYESEEHYKAYLMIKDIAPSLLSLGYTDAQYATAFSTTVEEVQNITAYWLFLDANSSAIISYNLLVDPREAQ